MLETIKIGFAGAHCTGKSEAAERLRADLAAECVRWGWPISVRLVRSSAAGCPHPLNRLATPYTQRWIRDAMAKAEADDHIRAAADNSRRSVVIHDRTPLDWNAYSEWLNVSGPQSMRGLYPQDAPGELAEDMAGYGLLYWTRPDGTPIASAGKRDMSLAWQAEIDRAFERVIAEAGIKTAPYSWPEAALEAALEIMAARWPEIGMRLPDALGDAPAREAAPGNQAAQKANQIAWMRLVTTDARENAHEARRQKALRRKAALAVSLMEGGAAAGLPDVEMRRLAGVAWAALIDMGKTSEIAGDFKSDVPTRAALEAALEALSRTTSRRARRLARRIFGLHGGAWKEEI